MKKTTQNSRIIQASAEKIFKALTDPQALETWQVPGNMTAKMHHFDKRVGGTYSMSLSYPETEKDMLGKTAAKEDRFTVRFLELAPNEKVVEAVLFDADDPAFSEEMIMKITLEAVGDSTKVTFTFSNLPDSIRPEDNEAGTISSLQKLAKYVE